ncbi:MAG: HNH endonuclease [Bacteroidota bacterium]|nr:HNH endonuclease [Bacteroidota bacterium]
MRNPKWHRDEIILALDLYFTKGRGSIDDKNPKILELSKILNALPLFTDRPDRQKFRNANGVTLKLSNFLAFDPNYSGKGMTSGSKLDKEVFFEFRDQLESLHSIASQIRMIAGNPNLKEKINEIEDDEQTQKDSVQEGGILYKLHKVRERDPKIIKHKKDLVYQLTGKLACEACILEFEEFYGEIGAGFIECHHLTPLKTFKVSSLTTLNDLALVCSNCHRMLHAGIDKISVADLSDMIKYDRVPKANPNSKFL